MAAIIQPLAVAAQRAGLTQALGRRTQAVRQRASFGRELRALGFQVKQLAQAPA